MTNSKDDHHQTDVPRATEDALKTDVTEASRLVETAKEEETVKEEETTGSKDRAPTIAVMIEVETTGAVLLTIRRNLDRALSAEILGIGPKNVSATQR